MAEMVIGEKVTLEEMGGARMHCSVSGCGDILCKTEEDAITQARQYISYFPTNYLEKPPLSTPQEPKQFDKSLEELIPKTKTLHLICKISLTE